MKPFNINNVPPDAVRDGWVFVGRPSPWGNPFVIGRDGNRDQVIAKYKTWVLSQPAMVSRAKVELAGKHLGCYCTPLACHADVLIEIANS